MPRKIIHITACGVENNMTTQCSAFVYALCDDGTVWAAANSRPDWIRLPDIPQGDETDEGARER